MSEEDRQLYVCIYSDLDDDFVFRETMYTLEDLHILEQENKKLNGTIQTYDILLKSNVEENKRLKNNWNELKRWLCEDEFLHIEEVSINSPLKRVLNKLQELERGVSDVED